MQSVAHNKSNFNLIAASLKKSIQSAFMHNFKESLAASATFPKRGP